MQRAKKGKNERATLRGIRTQLGTRHKLQHGKIRYFINGVHTRHRGEQDRGSVPGPGAALRSLLVGGLFGEHIGDVGASMAVDLGPTKF